jgi:GT2 family glycosyltransferase/glycosyltransferase involved in cell wall biosynthesis
VNYHRAEDTIACLRALVDEIDYPRYEIICVDNASIPEDFRRIKAAVPEAKVLPVKENLGFAAGCDLGAEHAHGSVLAFLNNDARADSQWIRAAVAELINNPQVAAVASKVLSWDGQDVDFVDAGLTWFGMGYKRHAGARLSEVPPSEHETAKDVLFGTGSAMFVRASVFAELDGFDSRFFMFYEDVDLGWRLNLRGWRFRYIPESIAYHKHHATMSEVDSPETGRELFLLERNALAALYKNLSEENLAKALPAALALVARRASARGELDPSQLDLANGAVPASEDPVAIPRTALAGLLAIDRFVELLPSLVTARAQEQAARVRTDADLVPLLRKALEPAYPLERYLQAHEILVDAFGLKSVFDTPEAAHHDQGQESGTSPGGTGRKIAVITGDTIGERMAGPAIRAWHIASTLSTEHTVRLITTNAGSQDPAKPSTEPFTVVKARVRDLRGHVEWADLIILQGHALEMASSLKKEHANKIVVCDLYDPMHLEVLEQAKNTPEDLRAAQVTGVTHVLDEQLKRGDFFLCASERQRLFWLGHLTAIGRLSPRLYDRDPTTRSLLSVVPFGLPAAPPSKTGPGLRSRLSISESDKVALWAGGVYNWFDPLSLVEAVGLLSERRSDVRLVFLGMLHPNPEVAEMDIGTRTETVANRLGLTDKHVFFNQEWVPYEERQNWLLEANCGVTTHFDHVETTLAFRTRVLDYLWTGLPVVTTDGDTFADLVREEALGVVVPAGDAQALAEALERCLYDEEFIATCRENLIKVAERFTWPVVLAPLVEFCGNPRPAADRLAGSADLVVSQPPQGKEAIRRDWHLLREYLAVGGAKELTKRALGRLSKVTRERALRAARKRSSHD